MFITVTHFKGGVGKTTSAVHFAAFLQWLSPTLLIDGDPNRAKTEFEKSPIALSKFERGYHHRPERTPLHLARIPQPSNTYPRPQTHNPPKSRA